MKKIIYIVGILVFFSLKYTYVEAFVPQKITSSANNCQYNIVGHTSSGALYNKGFTPISCNNISIDLPAILGTAEGIYKIQIKSQDHNELGTNQVFNDATGSSKTNKFGIWESGIYKRDLTPPICILQNITLLGVNNQYYNNNNLYYKSATDAVGKVELTIKCTEANTPSVMCGSVSCVGGITEVNFPTILGVTPAPFTYSPGVDEVIKTVTYNWSGQHNDVIDILNNAGHIMGKDAAGNTAILQNDANTKIIFKTSTGVVLSTNTGITSLLLTPDSSAPTIGNTIATGTILLSGSGFTHEESLANFTSIYDGDINTIRYFSANQNKQLKTPHFKDLTSGLRSFDINIEQSIAPLSMNTYSFTGSNLLGKQDEIFSSILTHDFSDVSVVGDYNNGYREYSWEVVSKIDDGVNKVGVICDMVGNCINITTPDYRVVANEPQLTAGSNNLGVPYNGRVSNHTDFYTTTVVYRDEYDNEIVPVNGVKQVVLNLVFDNSLGSDQLNTPNSGDGVNFIFRNRINILPGMNTSFNNFTFTGSVENDFKGGELNVRVASAVPTKQEYQSLGSDLLYGINSAKLELSDIIITVLSNTSYPGVGEKGPINYNSEGKPDYKFNPYININSIDTIAPLVEGQEKDINTSGIGTNNSFELDTYFGSNNLFLQFKNVKINGVDAGVNYNAILSKLVLQNTDFVSNSSLFAFTPKMIGGIEGANKKIAIFTNLKYTVNAIDVILPSIQTGFQNYGPHTDSEFGVGTNYDANSEVIISEVDIQGITQSNNGIGSSTGSNATTTDNNTFKDFSTITLLDLKTNINQNVNKLLRGYDSNDGMSGDKISNLSLGIIANGGLELNGGNVIYFKDRDIELDCGAVCEVIGKKTIIIENGNLFINSDMEYGDSNSILGIILLQTTPGVKGVLKINEDITNGVGIVYSEGPVVSYDGNPGHIYDGGNIGTSGLKNQLYWKGSFATRNTIGGAIKDINISTSCPYGTTDYDKPSCTTEQAQAYDLIYLRRYAVVAGIPLHSDTTSVYTAGGDEYSGSILNTVGVLKKPNNYHFNAPFILEYDSHFKSNTPIGFTQ